MATKLDDVLKIKQKVAEDNLLVYQKETEKTIKELSLRRTELHTLIAQIKAAERELDRKTKETVTQYSLEVQRLDSEIADRRDVIVQLNQAITDKNKEFSDHTNTARLAYEKQEALVANEHKNLIQKISLYDQQLAAAQSRFDHAETRHSDADTREIDLDNRTEALKKKETDFLNERNYLEGELTKGKKNLEHQVTSLRVEESALKYNQEQIKNREVDAAEVLKRINEVDELITKQNQIVEANRLERESLNADHVKMIAATRRLSQKEEDLKKKENTLNDREKNIKLAEEHLAQG